MKYLSILKINTLIYNRAVNSDALQAVFDMPTEEELKARGSS